MGNWIFRTETNEKLYKILKKLIKFSKINNEHEKLCDRDCYFRSIYSDCDCRLFGYLKKYSIYTHRFIHPLCKKIFDNTNKFNELVNNEELYQISKNRVWISSNRYCGISCLFRDQNDSCILFNKQNIHNKIRGPVRPKICRDIFGI